MTRTWILLILQLCANILENTVLSTDLLKHKLLVCVLGLQIHDYKATEYYLLVSVV